MEKMKRLLQLIDYKDQTIESYVSLDEIRISKQTKEMTLFFKSVYPIDVEVFFSFIDYLSNSSLIQKFDVNKINYDVLYASYNEKSVIEYYRFFVRKIVDSTSKLLEINGYEYHYDEENKELTIDVPENDLSFSLCRNELNSSFTTFGFKDIVIKFNTIKAPDDISVAEKIRKVRQEFIEKSSEYAVNEAKYEHLFNNAAFTGDVMKISDIPTTEGELEEMRAKRDKLNFVFSGDVVFLDTTNLDKKDSPRIVFIVNDGEQSVFCQKTIRDKDEYNFFKGLDKYQKVTVQGFPKYSDFHNEIIIYVTNMERTKDSVSRVTRIDDCPEKRVELHLHTKMSALDGVPSMDEYFEACQKFGHKAIAVTDHSSVQSYHDLFIATEKNKDIKPLYGLELTYVDEDKVKVTACETDANLHDATFTVLDIETTGLSVIYDKIIEISCFKVTSNQIGEEFHSFVNPEQDIPESVIKLTGISNNDVKNAEKRDVVLRRFYEFVKGTIIVAHNANFDMGHLYYNLKECKITEEKFPVIDTLVLAKLLYPGRQRYDLDSLCKFKKVILEQHHRADADARATSELFLHMLADIKGTGIKKLNQLNVLIDKESAFKIPYPNHINLLCKTEEGLKNLFHILSISSTEYFDREPKVTRKVLEKYRKGILVGTGCRNSYFFEIALNKSEEELREIIQFYDYVELQPVSSFVYYGRMMDNYRYVIQDTFRRIIAIAKEYNIPVVATGDCHQINKEDTIYREVLVNTPLVGGGLHYLSREDIVPDEYYMTTREMLTEFNFLGEELAYEIVIKNTNLIADSCDFVKSFKKELYAPTDTFLAQKGVRSIEQKVIQLVENKAHEMYGPILPGIVFDRVKKELNSITTHKFSTVYYISHLLVKKSLNDNYLVGSRGSVGSSIVAFLMEITEVNSLPPHYLCPKCKYSAFKMTDAEKTKYGVRTNEELFQQDLKQVGSGFDLPPAVCPVCGETLIRDGHDIPFETFLGFKGDKMPDIDLNFSGEYQANVHNYIREIFGADHAFRAGTISTCAKKTAFNMVGDYVDKVNGKRIRDGLEPIKMKRAERERISTFIEGSKRTSGQHPGGIVVVPNDHEIYDVTAVQYPGDSKDTSWKTTHFEYHSFEDNLFKLDVLGHDDPTMIRYLMSYVAKYPEDFPFSKPMDIPVNDARVYQLLSSTSILGLSKSDIQTDVASYGIPEMGTSFVRQMLSDSKPKTFAEIVKISGLSHGTDVWLDNAKDLVFGKAKGYPKVDFKEVIGCRDDIMIKLIDYGIEPEVAFKIMELVRKGNVRKKEDLWEEYTKTMKDHNVPPWFIWTCSKIKYLFPKAHATAYVIMAMRIAWFKLYQPIFFYSAFFSKRATEFDVYAMIRGESGILARMSEINSKGKDKTDKEDELMITLELSLEMHKRGFKFLPIDIEKSMTRDFLVSEDKKSLLLPFAVIDSLGDSVGDSIIEARREKPFTTKDDIRKRTKLSKTLFEKLDDLGVFSDLPEDNQITLDLKF